MATVEAPDAIPMYHHLLGEPGGTPRCTGRQRRQLLHVLGEAVGRMHRAGIVHGDLRPGNILARKSDGRWEVFFIDNERTKKWPFLPNRLRLKNLVQINMLPSDVSKTDRLRFFHAYLLLNPSVRPRYKEWARKAMSITRRRFQQKGWA